MATAIVPLPLFECSTLQHVHLSSMHLCRCRYVSIACMANPPPQFQSTHGRGRIQGTPLANMRHQQDVRGGTLANMRNQRINKCTAQCKTLSEETSSPMHEQEIKEEWDHLHFCPLIPAMHCTIKDMQWEILLLSSPNVQDVRAMLNRHFSGSTLLSWT